MSSLNKDGLKYLVAQLATKQKEQLEKIANHGSYSYWQEHDDYIAADGEIVIISDYGGTGDTVIAIGDGTTKVLELDLISTDARKLKHSLTIGNHIFDGTSDVEIEVYNGEVNEDELDIVLNTLSLMDIEDNSQMVNNFSSMAKITETAEMQLVSSTNTNQMQLVANNNNNEMQMEVSPLTMSIKND